MFLLNRLGWPLSFLGVALAAVPGCRSSTTGSQPTIERQTQVNPAVAGKGVDSDDIRVAAVGDPVAIEKVVSVQEVRLVRAGVPMKLWIYRPAVTGDAKIPLVLVPPAGSRLFHGMNLGDGDRPEHLPYARAGYVVVSFEIDGHFDESEDPSDESLFAAARAFNAAEFGVSNAKAALDYALRELPEVDPSAVFIAGHSSAATLALQAGAHERRIRGVIAYAPVSDLMGYLDPAVKMLNRQVPGIEQTAQRLSPKSDTKSLQCPVFLFHALDDTTVSASESEAFAERLRRTNPDVVLVTVPAGGHYDSMIREGIPGGIAWIRRQRGG